MKSCGRPAFQYETVAFSVWHTKYLQKAVEEKKKTWLILAHTWHIRTHFFYCLNFPCPLSHAKSLHAKNKLSTLFLQCPEYLNIRVI